MLASIAIPGSAGSLTLNPAAGAAWDEYVHGVNCRMEQRATAGQSYLWVDESPDRLKKLKAGEVIVTPIDSGMKKVPSALIHHWIGAIFIPGTRIEDVLHVVRDYPKYKDLYQPSVTASKAISKQEMKDQFATLMVNKSFLLKSAFETQYESQYVRLDKRRMYSFTKSTRIQEIEDFGAPDQRALPEGQGSGIMWRLSSVTRYAERDGGVYIEVEALGLTRDIPGSLHWLVDPIVRRVSKSALTISLRQTEKASKSAAEVARRERGEKLTSLQ
jgi:hypothetical protein